MKIAISSGKGGTGKTFVATNLARTYERNKRSVTYMDCDVEEPNGHLFLRPEISNKEDIMLLAPARVDREICISCGLCADACTYNAIAVVKDQVLIFNELCHVCGACSLVCPTNAVIEEERKIGEILGGKAGKINFTYGLLETGEGGMSPRLIQRVKRTAGEGINILDSPPGTACPVVEAIVGADLVILVTDPTPFGINDLKLSVNMCRELDIEPLVLVNRADNRNDDLWQYCKEADLEIIGEIPNDRKIAEVYSNGGLVVDEIPRYKELFQELGSKVEDAANREREVKPPETYTYTGETVTQRDLANQEGETGQDRGKEIIIISGKGGTGKTSLSGCFAVLEAETEGVKISDCDVDAADLHLLLNPEVRERGVFSGGFLAEINPEKCTRCGRCWEECRFEAVEKIEGGGKTEYKINEAACEGCGVCGIVCKDDAVKLDKSVNGEWYVSDTRAGPMAHARLGFAEENTGRLVTLVRNKAAEMGGGKTDINTVVDGAPGTGCPVIASLTGASYALIVTEPTVSGLHDMGRVIDVAQHFGIRAGVVVNKWDLNPEITERIEGLAKERGLDLPGNIPYDESITLAQIEGKSLVEYEDSETAKAVRSVWDKVRTLVSE